MTLKLVGIYIQVLFYLAAGLNHFLNPAVYVSMIPKWLPQPELLNTLSGLAEILAALLFAFPKTRWIGSWALVWTLLAVFPANVMMALEGPPENFPWQTEPWMLWARLPLQFLLMYWAFSLRYVGSGKKQAEVV